MRKALCVGINNYSKIRGLNGCVNDAIMIKNTLEYNGDGSKNFDVKLMCSTEQKPYISRNELKEAVEELFHSESEIAVFYFSGHGAFDSCGGYLCTSEVERPDEGLSLNDLMNYVEQSKAQNKVIILDSCHAGQVANSTKMDNNYAVLQQGTTILAACGKDEGSAERGGFGVFTSLLVEALEGGAMNLLGDVSPGSVYSYIDRSLGAWEQRPVFKANIQSFVSLRRNKPPIDIRDLRKITSIFSGPYAEFPLDPTFEPDKHEVTDQRVNKEHQETFALLQRFVKLNLVVPVGEEHMYYAAIHSKSCKLTAQGRHYWKLVANGRI